MESSRGRRARLQRSISIHLIDIRQPEVLLHQQPQHRDEKARDGKSQHLEKSCMDAQSTHVGITAHRVYIFEINMDLFTFWVTLSMPPMFIMQYKLSYTVSYTVLVVMWNYNH